MDFYEYDADEFEDSDLPLYYFIDTVNINRDDGYMHWHAATELLYCIEGTSVAVSETRHILLNPGDLAVINPSRLHNFYTHGPCKYAAVLLSPALTSAYDLTDKPIQPFVSDGEISRCMTEILTALEQKQPYYRAEVRAQLMMLFVDLRRRFPEGEPNENRSDNRRKIELVKAVIEYIRHNFAQPITVDSVCRAVSFSRSYVCHVFKEVTDQSLVQYINFVRCSNARILLASKNYTITECAEKSGFNTLSYFSRIYKKQMGVAPSEHFGKAE